MSGLVKTLNQSKWWRWFWLCWSAGFGIFDLVVGLWPFALVMAVMMTGLVITWMVIDRLTAE